MRLKQIMAKIVEAFPESNYVSIEPSFTLYREYEHYRDKQVGDLYDSHFRLYISFKDAPSFSRDFKKLSELIAYVDEELLVYKSVEKDLKG